MKKHCISFIPKCSGLIHQTLFILIAIYCILLCNTVNAITIQGTVTETSGNPVYGALVTFIDQSDSNNTYSAYTDENGRYEVSITVSVKEQKPELFTLYQSYPNPFNPSATIPFSLEQSGYVSLTIYNIMGQKVRILVDGHLYAGMHTFTWDSRDDQGKSVGAGIYLYQLRCGDKVQTRKMLLIDGGDMSGLNNNKLPPSTASKIISTKASNIYTVTVIKEGYFDYFQENIDITMITTFDIVLTPYESQYEVNGITFVTIPAGTFRMGDVENYGQFPNEKPVHTVTLSSFDMSIYEITQGQYQSVMGANPSFHKSGDNYPVEQVSWNMAVRFCNKLSDAAGL